MRAPRRTATAVSILALLLILNIQVVEITRLWCKTDAVVMLDNRVVDITLAIPLEFLLLVNSPSVIEITTPPSIDRQPIVNDIGFLHGSIVTFKDGGGVVRDGRIPVEINPSVSVDKSRLVPGKSVPFKIDVLTDYLLYETAIGTSDGTTMELVIYGR